MQPGSRVGSTGFRADVQGLRGVAVLLVALSHAGVRQVRGGFIGVDVFFVVSGFLITGLLLHESGERGRISLVRFYARRGRRILPAGTLVLVVTTIASYLLLDVVRARDVLRDAVWTAAFAANVHFAAVGTDYFARDLPPSPLQHYWSLAVEEQFYLLWPALLLGLLLLGRRRLRLRLGVALLALGALSLAWSVHQTATSPATAYFSSLTRAWELAAGAGVAVAAPLLLRLPAPAAAVGSWVGLGCVVTASMTYDATTTFPGLAAAVPVAGAALLVAGGGRSRWGADALLTVRPLRFVGDASYSFYLWHWPFLVVGAAYLGHDLTVPQSLLLVAAALVAASASYRWVENPFRRSPRLSRRSGFALALWPASICLVVAVAVTARGLAPPATPSTALAAAPTAGLPAAVPARDDGGLPAVRAAVEAADQPFPVRLRPAITELRSDTSHLPDACLAHEADTTSRVCVTGDRAASRTLLLLGDSHAFMWLPALQRIGRLDGWRVVVLMKFACTAADVTLRNGTASDRTCDTWRAWALRRAAALHPDLVMITGQVPYDVVVRGHEVTDTGGLAPLWQAGWASTLQRLHAAAGRVVLVGDAPGLPKDPVACVGRRGATRGDCTAPPVPHILALNAAARRAAAQTRTPYVDVQPWFCWQQRCPTVIASTFAYRDKGHISASYAAELWQPLRQALRSAAA